MKKYYVLFNPLSGNNTGTAKAEELRQIVLDGELEYINITEIEDYKEFFNYINKEDNVIICGGDGTLNKFINYTKNINFENFIYYYATGTGNDFLNDIKKEKNEICLINDYIKNLPTAIIKEEEYKFINGIGYGIDGYCCEEGDKLRGTTDKPINYTNIAIKGLLFHYHPTNAKIIVDGKSYEFKKVWLAPTMNGRFYGGGMMATPNQDRLNMKKTVSIAIMHGSGKVKTLMMFPSIFKGEHIKYKKNVTILTGKDILVEFDRPTALQVDGETILDVTKYQVKVNNKEFINV